MKRFMLSILLAVGCISAAEAVPPCWPNRPVNVATHLYLSPAYLLNWWQTHTVPDNVANPHYYVAFHATDEYCKAHYGPSAWAAITGPYALTNTVNGTIWEGVYFDCRKCPSEYPQDPEPAPIDPPKE